MKLNMLNLILIVVVFSLIASILLVSCTVVQPYSEYNIYRNEYPYEGFSNYSNTNNSENTDEIINNFLLNSSNADCSKVFGFNGLFCKPYIADKNIDIFSTAKGETSCIGKSSGLSNSKGGLCIDGDDKKLLYMLQTRGGNQTKKEMQIG
jgi:hypothetical protein